jgi:hypothetical protein
MKTVITLVITHKKPVPNMADLIAQRAYTIDGINNVTSGMSEEECESVIGCGLSNCKVPDECAHLPVTLEHGYSQGIMSMSTCEGMVFDAN